MALVSLGTSPRAWFDAVSWHVRGVFASEENRRLGFRARALWQPAEVEARRGVARELQADLLPELRVDRAVGHLVLPPTAMPAVDEVCRIGASIISDASLDVGVANGQKKFSRFRLATMDERAAVLRLGLDRRMLAMAASYLGVLPVITEADFFCSFPVIGAFTKSQLWHCDDDAGDVFKLFVYCDDVTEADGPFELVQPLRSKAVRNAIGYRYAGRRYRVSDEVMDRYAPGAEQRAILGKKGTAFVVDTVRSFHRGSRIVEPDRRRVVALVCYCPPNGRTLPRRLAVGNAPLAAFATRFPGELEQAALGMPLAKRWL